MKGTWQGSGTWQTSGGGGGLVALVVVLAISVAVLHAIWHAIVEAAEIAALVVVSAIGAAALVGVTYAALRIRAYVLEQRARREVRPNVIRLSKTAVQSRPGPGSLWTAEMDSPPALEPPAVRLHPDQLAELAAILRRSQRPEQQEEGTAR